MASWVGASWVLYLAITGAACLVFAATRDRSQLYLAIGATAFLLYTSGMHGYSDRYLWPGWPAWDSAWLTSPKKS